MDIDGGRPGQLCYPWTWVPTTENLMYMMPQAGIRVSRYFRGDEEESVLTVNCIRGGKGCREANPLDKSLTTEHGMQMRLCRCDMGVVALKEKVLLDDLTGIRMEGSGGLHILADGEVKLVWKHGIIGETNEFLPSNKAGRFDAASGILYLRSNPAHTSHTKIRHTTRNYATLGIWKRFFQFSGSLLIKRDTSSAIWHSDAL